MKLVDQCRRESRNLTGISHLQRHRLLPPRSMPTTPETACSGMKIKFIDCDPHFYTCRVKEAIHITPHSNNIKKDNGIEIPEAWKLTIQKHNSSIEPCNRGPQRETDLKAAPITAVEFNPITAKHNSI